MLISNTLTGERGKSKPLPILYYIHMINKTKRFSKELDKAKKKYTTDQERLAFLEGVGFYCDWKIGGYDD